jgi:hypothetical protein
MEVIDEAIGYMTNLDDLGSQEVNDTAWRICLVLSRQKAMLQHLIDHGVGMTDMVAVTAPPRTDGKPSPAGLLACPPVDPEARLGIPYTPNPLAVVADCVECGQAVYLGPRQQLVREHHPEVHVICVPCCCRLYPPPPFSRLITLSDAEEAMANGS